jgi:hypothetical protein
MCLGKRLKMASATASLYGGVPNHTLFTNTLTELGSASRKSMTSTV